MRRIGRPELNLSRETEQGLASVLGYEIRIKPRILRDTNRHNPRFWEIFSGEPFVAFGDIDRNANALDIEWPLGTQCIPFATLNPESDGLIEKLQGAKLIVDFEAGYDRSDAAANSDCMNFTACETSWPGNPKANASLRAWNERKPTAGSIVSLKIFSGVCHSVAVRFFDGSANQRDIFSLFTFWFRKAGKHRLLGDLLARRKFYSFSK